MITLEKNLILDIIYYKYHLDKTFDIKLDLENIEIGNKQEESPFENNPFSNILSEQKEEKDEFLDRLKNIDLSTPKTHEIQENNNISQVSNITEKIISSPKSKINSGNTSNISSFGGSSDEKLSAIGMLANSVLNKDSHNPPQEPFKRFRRVILTLQEMKFKENLPMRIF